MIFAVLAFAAALTQTSSAQAQAGGQVDANANAAVGTSAASGAVAAAPPQERLICTTQQITGTRFPVRRCRTAAQVEADRAESQEMLRRQQGARVPNL